MAEWNLAATPLVIDHDTKVTESFETVFESEGVQVIRVGPATPSINAHAERWMRTLRGECLDQCVQGELPMR